MATTTKPTTESKPPKVKGPKVSVFEKLKKQVNDAVLKGHVTAAELEELQARIAKAIAFLA